MKVFVSYSQEDYKEDAEILWYYIKKYATNSMPDLEIFIDQVKTKGQKWRLVNDRNLKESNIVVVILTTASVESKEVKREIKIAEKMKKTIIPCKDQMLGLDWKDVPLKLDKFDGIEFNCLSNLKRRLFSEIKKIYDEKNDKQNPIKVSSNIHWTPNIKKITQDLKKNSDLTIEEIRHKIIYLSNKSTSEIIEVINGTSFVLCRTCNSQYCKHVVYAGTIPEVQQMWNDCGIVNLVDSWNKIITESHSRKKELAKKMRLELIDDEKVFLKDVAKNISVLIEVNRGRMRCHSCNVSLDGTCDHILFALTLHAVTSLLSKKQIIDDSILKLSHDLNHIKSQKYNLKNS